jgi:anti-anti-sigma factor
MGTSMRLGHSEGLPVLAVSGELDWLSCSEFEQRIREAARGSSECVVVDLSDVSYIESSPLGILIKIHASLEREGGDVAIVCAGSEVSRVINEFGIDHLLPIFSDLPSAVHSLLPLIADLH